MSKVDEIIQEVRAIKDYKGGSTDLVFKKGDVIHVSQKDGVGWAFGKLDDGSFGWFPLEKVELLTESELSESENSESSETLGKSGDNALKMFISEAKKKNHVTKINSPAVPNIKLSKQETLMEFLSTRPLVDQLVEKKLLPSTEIEEQVAAAQKKLLKNEKKGKGERFDYLVRELQRGKLHLDNQLNINEAQIDRVAVEIVSRIPVSKQKILFSTYEDVFSGSLLVQKLSQDCCDIFPDWGETPPSTMILSLCSYLIERNVIFNVSHPTKTTFKTKFYYKLTSSITEYSCLNLNKICDPSGNPQNAYELSIKLATEISTAMKAMLPDLGLLRRSPELLFFSYHLSYFQLSNLSELNENQRLICFINIYNALIMYTHAKFNPPGNALEKRYLYEYCSIYISGRKYSISDIESEILKDAKSDPALYFCLSDGTTSTPATFIFTTKNFDQTKQFAARHFLNQAMKFDTGDYVITFPRLVQRMWKDLKVEKEALIHLIQPYLARAKREEIDQLKEMNIEMDVQFFPYSFDSSFIFEEASALSPR